jgi:hypothetical protein
MTVEDRVRRALAAQAGLVTPERLRPPAPPTTTVRAHRWPALPVLAAGGTVAAVAILVAVLAGPRPAPEPPPGPPPVVPGAGFRSSGASPDGRPPGVTAVPALPGRPALSPIPAGPRR